MPLRRLRHKGARAQGHSTGLPRQSDGTDLPGHGPGFELFRRPPWARRRTGLEGRRLERALRLNPMNQEMHTMNEVHCMQQRHSAKERVQRKERRCRKFRRKKFSKIFRRLAPVVALGYKRRTRPKLRKWRNPRGLRPWGHVSGGGSQKICESPVLFRT